MGAAAEEEEEEEEDRWDDDIFDEEYFEQMDDFLLDLNETKKTILTEKEKCLAKIDEKYGKIDNHHGFDYLISEFQQVPGYDLLPNGVIYAKSTMRINILNYIRSYF